MPYALLIVEPREQRRQRGLQEDQNAYAQMLQFADGLKARGLLLGCESLKSDTEAVRLQRREGKRILVDGPFSEAKEMIGGFFLLGCASREEAIAIAADCPAAEWATVEVRELGPCYS